MTDTQVGQILASRGYTRLPCDWAHQLWEKQETAIELVVVQGKVRMFAALQAGGQWVYAHEIAREPKQVRTFAKTAEQYAGRLLMRFSNN